jgi:hypothetical protein
MPLNKGVMMKKTMCIISTHLLAILIFGLGEAKATAISGISHNSASIGKYTKYELTFTISPAYTNPFEPCEVDVMVRFHQPDGTEVNIPGFYYRLYNPSGSNPETYPTAGAISWKARFAPSQLGSHSCDIIVRDANGITTANNARTFTCVESGKKGFIRIDPNQHDFLKYDNGDTYIPIGENIGWNGGGTYRWDYYLKKMHNAGANWVRLWSCPYGDSGGGNSDMAVLLEGKIGLWGTTYFQGCGKPSQQTSMRMDRYVEIAEQNDIAIQFALQHHGQVSTDTDSDWANNPYNSANPGGFLPDPCKYFTNTNAIKQTKNKYRYIVARWGYSTSIYAWELFNEVQWTNGWKKEPANVVAWHSTMASYIRSLDAFRHPVTTSSHGPGFENLWNLPDINLVEHHYYGNNTISVIEQTAQTLQDFNKPVLFAEFGLGGNPEGDSNMPEPYASQLKEGLEMHNGIWAAFLTKSTANLWWWDNYIDPCNLYGVYSPLAVYAAGENLADCNLVTAPWAVSGMKAVHANPGLTSFDAITDQNIFYLDVDYFPGMEKLSQWLHGTTKDYLGVRSDPNFHLTMPIAGSLRIHVSDTADWCSNSLRVRVNGVQIFSGTYPADANNFVITVPLSAGQQSVHIENTGLDWFNINDYEFTTTMLGSIGLAGKQRGYYWIYDSDSQYGLINNGTFHNEQVVAKGLSDGLYDVDVYNTRSSGGVINSGTANSVAGQLTYTLPDFTKDIAVKVTGVVDIYDLDAFCNYWLQTGSSIAADLNHDGKVDFVDFAILANYWMENTPGNWPF